VLTVIILAFVCAHTLKPILFTGAIAVVFSDYNKEVIEFVTIPNVIANCPTAIQYQQQQQVQQPQDESAHTTSSSNSSIDHCKHDILHTTDSDNDQTSISDSKDSSAAMFYSGDWLSLPEQLSQHDSVGNQFDLILTAETLYTEQAATQVL
jgi:hypothetical protein